jgi:hypothetical protein
MSVPTIIQCMESEKLFARWFRNQESFSAWKVYLKTVFALPLNDSELEIFKECTGRTTPPTEEVNEIWTVVGRRGGKSLLLATICVYLAFFRDYSPHLVPGERGTILVLSPTKDQAKTIYRYALALIKETKVLAAIAKVTRETDEVLELSNNITITVQSANFRTVRGFTCVSALLDECSFFRDETSTNADQLILDALRPAMSTIPNAKLMAASSPYAKRGILWNNYRRYFGQNESAPLVWQGSSKKMNPSIPQAVIDEAYDRDSSSASAEFGGLFRDDIENFVSQEILDAVTVPGRTELGYVNGAHSYRAFCDPSGGSSDSFTLAIAHREENCGILDAICEKKPPFSPQAVIEEFSALLKSYHISSVMGDRYGGEFPRELYRNFGITYELATMPASDYYRELLPLLTSRKVELLDNTRLNAQLLGLERRTARLGKDSISHSPGAHDDLANSVAGALVMAAGEPDWVTTWLKCAGLADA